MRGHNRPVIIQESARFFFENEPICFVEMVYRLYLTKKKLLTFTDKRGLIAYSSLTRLNLVEISFWSMT